jgi:hypothetical protein
MTDDAEDQGSWMDGWCQERISELTHESGLCSGITDISR